MPPGCEPAAPDAAAPKSPPSACPSAATLTPNAWQPPDGRAGDPAAAGAVQASMPANTAVTNTFERITRLLLEKLAKANDLRVARATQTRAPVLDPVG